MTTYAIHAQFQLPPGFFEAGNFAGPVSVPTLYLRGIADEQDAVSVATRIIDPLSMIGAGNLVVTVETDNDPC